MIKYAESVEAVLVKLGVATVLENTTKIEF
jgi:hypothetical protein